MTLAQLDPKRLRPTPEEPIPSLAGAPGLKLLRSATAPALAAMVTPEDRAMVAETCRAVLLSLSPASVLEVGTVLEGLALHYPQFRRTAGENRVAMRQWAEDLEGWPLDMLEEAARRWRNSDTDRFPTPGQFKATILAALHGRKVLGRRAAEYLAIVDGQQPKGA